MILKFIFLFKRFNLAFLSFKKRQKVIKKKLIYTKLIKIFKYKKNNNRYWNRAKLYQQVINKALFIVKVFYFSYLFLFFLIMLLII